MVNLSGAFNTFRTSFTFPNKNILHWFPGHMNKGIKQMKQKFKSVDCIVEVHDARIPLSGRNKNFKHIFGNLKPHILVLNKKDLAQLQNKNKIIDYFKKENISSILFTNCKDLECSGLRKLVPTIKNLITQSDRYNRSECEDYSIMITGVPNVGKSSVINALRHMYLKKTRAAAVGGVAGITRSVTSKIKVSQVPLIYILDTPGILDPTVEDMEAGFKLALCSAMQDHLVGPINIADYLLFWLNKNKNHSYVEYLGVNEPCDDIMELLILASVKLERTIKRRNLEGGYLIQPDVEYTANYFIRGFRTGAFGKVMLDDEFT